MSCLAKLYLGRPHNRENVFLSVAQLAEEKLGAASFGQSKLDGGMNRADMIEKERRLGQLQKMRIVRAGQSHPERLINSKFSDVHGGGKTKINPPGDRSNR